MISKTRLLSLILSLAAFLILAAGDEAVMDLDSALESTTTAETQATASTQPGENVVEQKSSQEDTLRNTEPQNEVADETALIGDDVDGQSDTAATQDQIPPQAGPLIDLFGPQLLSLQMVDSTHAQLVPHLTNEALKGKEVIGVYFSADWCGPCRKFTPELMSFYNKMNARKGKQDQFQIVWVSRCRDMNSYGQYFAQMNGWLALPPQEAMGQRGEMLMKKYNAKGIPTLVLLDDLGQVITTDARNKIPADKAGIGFPWRNPISNIYINLVPRPVRFMIKSQINGMKDLLVGKVKQLIQAKNVAKAT